MLKRKRKSHKEEEGKQNEVERKQDAQRGARNHSSLQSSARSTKSRPCERTTSASEGSASKEDGQGEKDRRISEGEGGSS